MKLLVNGKTLYRVDNADINKDGGFVFPEGVTNLGMGAFMGCTKLKYLNIPPSINSIEQSALSTCVDLRMVSVGPGVLSINEFTFHYCYNLQTIVIPEEILFIHETAFFDCPKLKNIVIASSDEAAINRITTLLPNYLRSKIVPAELAQESFQIRDEQLSRLAKTAETNPLYRFFNQNAKNSTDSGAPNRGVHPLQTLPNNIFAAINPFVINESLYYQKALTRIMEVPLPKIKEEVAEYKQKLEFIVTECIAKAMKFNSPNMGAGEDQECTFVVPKNLSCQLL